MLHDHIAILHDHITILIISQYYMIISQYYMIISQYYMIIAQYYLIISQYYMIISSFHAITEPNQSPKTPSVLSSHYQATASPPQANIGLRVRNRHLKSARKYVIPGRKQALVKDNGKSVGESCACSPATLSTEGFFKKLIRALVFSCDVIQIPNKHDISELRSFLLWSPFGRPTPVWGPPVGVICF